MLRFFSAFALFYLWHSTGITVGYHRLLSHRAFTCLKPVEYFFVLGGYLALQGSPMWWSAIHRAHHKYTDTELDPHSPRFGFKNAHHGWLVQKTYPSHIDPHVQCPDLMKDPIYKTLDQDGDWHRAHLVDFAFCTLFRLALAKVFGARVALASIVAGIAVHQIPLMLNVVCHKPRLGYKSFTTDDDSVNVWWVAWLVNGEGWHNNHHAFPGSARSGFERHEFDLSWLIIRGLQRLGWVTSVNVPADEVVAARTEAFAATSTPSVPAVTVPRTARQRLLQLQRKELFRRAKLALAK